MRFAECVVCGREYQQKVRWGVLQRHCSLPCAARGRPTPADRLWGRVERREDGCWVWTGSVNDKGYGRIGGGRRQAVALTHRLAYESAVGPIPEGLCVLHRCDNPPCCNPEHLFLGTRADNNADAKAKGRVRPGVSRGEKQGSAKLTEAAVREIIAARGVVPTAALAGRYGVARSTIIKIQARRAWRHVQAA